MVKLTESTTKIANFCLEVNYYRASDTLAWPAKKRFPTIQLQRPRVVLAFAEKSSQKKEEMSKGKPEAIGSDKELMAKSLGWTFSFPPNALKFARIQFKRILHKIGSTETWRL